MVLREPPAPAHLARRKVFPRCLGALVALGMLPTLCLLSGCGHVGQPRTFAFNAPIVASEPTATPAFRYAGLDRTACEAELHRRSIPFDSVEGARGVLAPVRLTGALDGVAFHSVLPASQRAKTPFEIADCRLVLALSDFAGVLLRHGVAEVVHLSMYRPPPRQWPSGKIGSRHDGALAIDVGRFIKKDGTTLDVEKDFHGRIGTTTCGPADAGPVPATPEAIELRQIVCETADLHLFNVELTPDYNWQHRNHFHLELAAKVRWFLVH